MNTAGYTRQRAVLESLSYGGVTATGVQRIRDNFVAARLLTSDSRLGGRSVTASALQQIETALGESDDAGLTKSIQEFFGAVQALSARPDGTNEREALRSQSRQLIASFSGVSGQIGQIRDQLDQQIAQQTDRVNVLAGEIAQINREIGGYGGASGESAEGGDLNQLQDRRDQLVGELATIIPVRVMRGNNDAVTVFSGSFPLVEGDRVQELRLSVDPNNGGYRNVTLADLGGTSRNLAPELTEGSLGALLRARDGEARSFLDQVERLAATLMRDVNAVHRQGQGLDGVSGRDFFGGLAATATAAIANKGAATVGAATILGEGALDFARYEIRFTGGSTYDVVNLDDGQTVSTGNAFAAGGSIDVGGMRLTLSGGAPAAGDKFQLDAFRGVTERMGLAAGVAANAQAIAAGETSASGDNRNTLALLALRDEAAIGGQTYESFYSGVRVGLATRVELAEGAQAEEEIARQQVQALHDSVSGVSLDEEAAQLIQYQRAFEAASRIVRVTDELLQTLLGMV